MNKLKFFYESKRFIYPKSIVEKGIEEFKTKLEKYYVIYGELGSHQSPDINLLKISHKIINVELIKDFMEVEFKPLDTSDGNILKSLIKEKNKLSLSPRLFGKLNKNIVNSLLIITFDIKII